MNPKFQQLLAQATHLTRAGDLRAATAAIQAALLQTPDTPPSPHAPGAADEPGEIIDVQAREIPNVAPERAQLEPDSSEPAPLGRSSFSTHTLAQGGTQRDYKLFVPPQAGERPLPLVVMLHGCTQNPDDFAAGTAMNDAALAQGFYVLYPAQSRKANPQGCWNWFKHTHQQRDRGEPGLIAAMTREVMARHRVDADRVYVAGLSAGGAMAAIVGELYPELFAAVGVHSGLAANAAADLPSALAAMKGATASPKPAAGGGSGVPTIVFHGDADSTVHARNGASVVFSATGQVEPSETEHVQGAGRRHATRHLHCHADGRVLAEHWVVHGGSHAWFGGSPQGSYTDASGPDATEEMLRFFFEHPRKPAH
ncbi:PHB depolymerase family esterase [Variovorax dokdonensis]|uniref:PHB depolymerase family esterase n=1 Tax=Variovorax dokdonensis TaxID=344883 RepID=A0ABT7N8B4_9BURK|nr:PHB depolymerase family esterase [Variovorax dokdonensis]MDM0044166.1 PHB depolymerase family esterase [Variovorax dokdonensis]